MAPLKVYLAGPWQSHAYFSQCAEDLEAAGLEITHAWFRKNIGLTSTCDALLDTLGVANCDVFVAYMTLDDYRYAGTFTELGMAIALRKMIFLVCPPPKAEGAVQTWKTNVFVNLGMCHRVASWQELLQSLGVRDKDGNVPAKRARVE